MTEISVETKIKQAHQYFDNQEFNRAANLDQELTKENPQLRSTLCIRLAHWYTYLKIKFLEDKIKQQMFNKIYHTSQRTKYRSR